MQEIINEITYMLRIICVFGVGSLYTFVAFVGIHRLLEQWFNFKKDSVTVAATIVIGALMVVIIAALKDIGL